MCIYDSAFTNFLPTVLLADIFSGFEFTVIYSIFFHVKTFFLILIYIIFPIINFYIYIKEF